jgi:hypothetical protein
VASVTQKSEVFDIINIFIGPFGHFWAYKVVAIFSGLFFSQKPIGAIL